MGGPGGRTRDGAIAEWPRARGAVEASPPRRGGVTKPCFLYSDNHRGAQIWIRCGSSRGQSSDRPGLLKGCRCFNWGSWKSPMIAADFVNLVDSICPGVFMLLRTSAVYRLTGNTFACTFRLRGCNCKHVVNSLIYTASLDF